MAIIGTFKRTTDGSYAGDLTTLTLRRQVRLVPAEAAGDNGPELRVFAGPAEIGAAWRRTSRGGDSYLALRLDDPSFPAAIWANLVESKREAGVFSLLWDRPSRSSEAAG